MKRLLLLLPLFVFAQTEVPLWEGEMPGSATDRSESLVTKKKDDGVIRITNVSTPTLNFFPAEGGNTPVVIVCPGGGYQILSYNMEGTEVAKWLNSIGISAVVLKYRVPANREGALLDARKAVRTLRENPHGWPIDSSRIGMLGFSAGGHLTAACSTSVDAPDLSVLIYPAYLFQKGSLDLPDDIQVTTDTPPAFILQTQDDKKYYHSSLAYAIALDRAGVRTELHLFETGGHGYGLGRGTHPVSDWPELCEKWLKANKFSGK